MNHFLTMATNRLRFMSATCFIYEFIVIEAHAAAYTAFGKKFRLNNNNNNNLFCKTFTYGMGEILKFQRNNLHAHRLSFALKPKMCYLNCANKLYRINVGYLYFVCASVRLALASGPD